MKLNNTNEKKTSGFKVFTPTEKSEQEDWYEMPKAFETSPQYTCMT